MQMNEMSYSDVQPIDGYGPGFFRIGGTAYNGALVITATGVASWQGYDDKAPLLDLAGQIDVLLIGTGPEISHIPPALRASLEEAGLGAEVMNSPAACRTYNVLIAEGRRIGAAVLPV